MKEKKDEEIKTEEKATEKVEEKAEVVPEKKEDEKKTEAPIEEVKKEEVKSDDIEQKGEEKPEIAEEEKAETTVEETEPVGNGARIEDLVTKEELAERLAAFESKFEAILKENADLKDQNAKIKEKYEERDFGGFQKQGLVDSDKVANDTFESYSQQFITK